MIAAVAHSRPVMAMGQVVQKALSPLTALIHQVAQKVFGYLLRITFFQMGEFNVPGARAIIRAFQFTTCDPRELRPFDMDRLEEARKLLKSCGGQEAFLVPADKKNHVHCMVFKAQNFFAHFESLGIFREEHPFQNPVTGQSEQRKFLVPNETACQDPKTLAQFHIEAKKFRYELVDIATDHGTVKAALLPKSPDFKEDEPHPIILHTHSPGRSLCMELRIVGQFVGAGYDLALWDPRGTVLSKSTDPNEDIRITEAGEYLDADAVFKHLAGWEANSTHSYPPQRIYVSGFCKGASTAAFLAKHYERHAVPFIAANPFDTLPKLIDSSGWVGRLFGKYGLHAIQADKDKDSETIARLQEIGEKEDFYDTPAKFRQLSPSEKGPLFVISTDTDRLVPKDSVKRIEEAVSGLRSFHHIERNHPKKNQDGHTSPPYDVPEIWDQWIQIVR